MFEGEKQGCLAAKRPLCLSRVLDGGIEERADYGFLLDREKNWWVSGKVFTSKDTNSNRENEET